MKLIRVCQAAILAWVLPVRADTVVLYERSELRPSLCSALRIQLTGVADVQCVPDLAGADRIGAASRALAGDARLAVLLEADEHYARMLIVGDQPDRALLAIEPAQGPEPDVDRALALKVRETLERPRPLVLPQRTTAGLVELGGGLSPGAHSRGMGLLALGVRRSAAQSFGELVLLGRLASAIDDARVREREWALGVGGRWGFRLGRVSLGPAIDVMLVRASAHGESADGREGHATRLFSRLDFALDLRVSLGPVALRFAPALQLDPQAQRFTVEREALELKHVHVLLPLSVVIGVGS